jgi:hypothetical protein
MATGRNNQLTRQVGEHLVAAKLGRLGFVASPFADNVALLFCAEVSAREQSPRTAFIASKNACKDVFDAKLCWLAKPLAGDRIVRVRAELSE